MSEVTTNTQLLCTFTEEEDVDLTVSKIQSTYDLVSPVFVLRNADEDELFCTYNIDADTDVDGGFLDHTISIHRNCGTNTLYTINGLNALIADINGELDKTFDVPWENYQNSFVVTKNGELKIVDTELEDIINPR